MRPGAALTVALAAAALWPAAAGSKGKRKGGDASGKKEGQSARQHTEELTAATFWDKVEKVANDTEQPPYLPFVMFHMPWCEHCKKAIPEFAECASKVAQLAKQGQLSSLPAVPRFFLLSCDSEGASEICLKHTGKSYPSLILFRDRRAFRFSRPRVSNVITWWVFRVVRPAVVPATTRAVVDSTADQEVTFVLHLPSDSDAQEELLGIWGRLALDFLEDHSFYFTTEDLPLGRSLGAAPSVHVHGPASLGLKPLPCPKRLDEASLQAWVNFNRFSPVTALSPWTMGALRGAGLPVVTLVHPTNAAARKAHREFEQRILHLRSGGKFLFSTLNSTVEDNAYLLSHKFPLIDGSAPRILIFSAVGDSLHYWEDPAFPSADNLTIEAIEDLLASAEAFHDGSMASWLKERRKLVVRFASRSWTSLLIAMAVPSVVVCFAYYCLKALWQGIWEAEDQIGEDASKHDHVD